MILLIVHPFSSGRAQDKVETWAFITKLREHGFHVIDKLIDEPMSYPDFLFDVWGRDDDLLIIEDDKVAKVADVVEIQNCGMDFCAFPYPFSNHFSTSLEDWTPFPYSLGFTKFSARAQKILPADIWYREGQHYGLDAMIERPLMDKIGDVHLHQKMIVHNHRATVAKVMENSALLILKGWGVR